MKTLLNIKQNNFLIKYEILKYVFLFISLNKRLLVGINDIRKNLKTIKILDSLVLILILLGDNILIKEKFLNKNNSFLLKHLTLLVKKYNRTLKTNRTKTRSDISFSGRKLWKQKGTGRSRIGSKSSPLLRGGGVVFGPSGNIRFIKINKKLKKKLFFNVFVKKINKLLLFDLINYNEIKSMTTKNLVFLTGYTYYNKNNIFLRFSNYKNISIKSIKNINAFDLLKADYIIINKSDFFSLINRLMS